MTVPPLALLIICGVAASVLAYVFPILSFDAPLWLIGFQMVAAVAFLLLAVVDFRKHRTSVNPISPGAATVLVTNGVYGITRNPMYVGMLLALTSFISWLGASSAIVTLFVFYSLIDRRQIVLEERVLQNKFGEAYRTYSERVPRWLFRRRPE